MSDLTNVERRKLERLFEMGGGYVLDFSNRTFEEFVTDTIGRNIYDSRYNHGSGSKANRLRGFWQAEPNYVVGKLLGASSTIKRRSRTRTKFRVTSMQRRSLKN